MAPDPRDVDAVTELLGRTPRGEFEVVVRDEAGAPVVIRNAPLLDDGTPIHYAWGLSVRTRRGLPIVSHGGNFPGWESKMVRFPTENVTVIVLANREDLDVSGMAFRLAEEVLASVIDPDAPHADDTFDGV